MGLTDKYDAFYKSDGQREVLPDLCVRKSPRNRMEAIVAVEGTGEAILDIGCGDGRLLYQFRSRYKKLIGLEYSAERLRQAHANLVALNFQGLEGSAEDMGQIPTESIDRIVTADVIEHIPDVYAACSEMYRVLVPGGTLVINTPNIAFLKKRLLLLAGRFPSTSQPNEGLGSDLLFDGGHLHYFTYRSLGLVLERAGFEVLRRMAFGRFGPLHRVWPSLTSGGVQLVAAKPTQPKRQSR